VKTDVKIPAGRFTLDGILTVPESVTAIVLFVHGSGSSRHSPRNEFVARALNRVGRLRRYCSTYLLPRKKQLIFTRPSIAPTSTC
jgi:predicted alpha/beta-hydrolase family hydrolase